MQAQIDRALKNKNSRLEVPGNEKELEEWDTVIKPQSSAFDLQLKEIWRYKDLLFLFVRRDYVTFYKQTVLGPIWFFLQPVLTTIIFTFVFGKVAGISTNGIPQVLFYLSGIVLWNYFAECINNTSGVFIKNAEIFGKVYFPRIIMPMSIVISNMMRLGVQFFLFLAVYFFFIFQGADLRITPVIALFPLLLLIMAGLGLGIGALISSLTTKYRDLTFLISFGVQLAMYASPVIYPISSLPEKYRWLILANPMSPVIETFRFGFFGQGTFDWMHLGYSVIFTIGVVLGGALVFNKVQRSFMDTV